MCVGHSLENSQALCCKIVETEIFEARTSLTDDGGGKDPRLICFSELIPVRCGFGIWQPSALRPLAAVLLAAAAALFKGGMDMI